MAAALPLSHPRHAAFVSILSGLPSVLVEPVVRSLMFLLPGLTPPTSLVGFDAFVRRLLPTAGAESRLLELAVRLGARAAAPWRSVT